MLSPRPQKTSVACVPVRLGHAADGIQLHLRFLDLFVKFFVSNASLPAGRRKGHWQIRQASVIQGLIVPPCYPPVYVPGAINRDFLLCCC